MRSRVRLRFAIRAVLSRRKAFGVSSDTQSVFGLLCRPPYAVPLASSAGGRPQSLGLVEAVRTGLERLHVEQLLERNADPDAFDSDGLGALHIACARNRLALLHLLLSAGADVELISQDTRKLRPLHIAIQSAYGVGLAGVGALLAHGADPWTTRADGKAAVTIACGTKFARLVSPVADTWRGAPEGAPLVRRAALPCAVACGRRARVRALLLAHNTLPDSTDEHGNAGAHLASARGDLLVLSLLLAAGASANLTAHNSNGARPLHCAAMIGSMGCIQRLLQARADAM